MRFVHFAALKESVRQAAGCAGSNHPIDGCPRHQAIDDSFARRPCVALRAGRFRFWRFITRSPRRDALRWKAEISKIPPDDAEHLFGADKLYRHSAKRARNVGLRRCTSVNNLTAPKICANPLSEQTPPKTRHGDMREEKSVI